jgi:cytochrome c oxidase subunit 2
MLELLGMPPPASSHAADIDHIVVLVHWLMALLLVGWGTYFVYALVRFRAGANPKASYYGVKATWSKWVEGAVLVVEIVLLVFYSMPIYAERVAEFPAEDESVVVRVVAEQFAWNIHYPGADRKFGRTDIKLVSAANPLGLDRSDPDAKDDLTTINQLNLPVNKPAIVHLSSKDVIHSFGLPQMRVKQDAIPGIVHNLWFTPTVVTPTAADGSNTWEIACSQLCGLGHYRMRGFYTIQEQADFDKWLATETAALAAQ